MVSVLQNVLQIIGLMLYRNFILYLIIQVVCTLGNNLAISLYVDKKYKFIKDYSNAKVDDNTSAELKKCFCNVSKQNKLSRGNFHIKHFNFEIC